MSRLARQGAFLCALLATLSLATPPTARADERAYLFGEGLTFVFDERDRGLAEQIWPLMIADRHEIMERLRLFPQGALRVVLAPTQAAFEEATGGVLAEALGVYIPHQRTIVLRSPRTRGEGHWDPRGVARHELAHGILDLSIAGPIPRWLNEGLAILVAGELSFLDDSQLSWLAFRERLIPLPLLMATFPEQELAMNTAYAQAASFARFLLRRDGMAGITRLLDRMARGDGAERAFSLTYGEPLSALEEAWRQELSGNFSWAALVTPISVLGGVGAPLAVIAWWRRRQDARRRMRAWPEEPDAGAAPIPRDEGTPGFGIPVPAGDDPAAPRAAGRPTRVWRPPMSGD